MRRRDFTVGIASIAAGWPLAGRAERTPPLIGFLNGGSPTFAPYLNGFRQSLKDAGYIEGQNLLIEYRWAEGRYDRLPRLAAELLVRDVRVLVVNTPASKVAQAATTTTPIVFVVGADPVELGLIKSLNHPGGNLTGIVSLVDETGPKRVELLRELLPTNSIIAHLINPANPAAVTMSASVTEAAKKLGQTVHTLNVSNDGQIGGAFEQLTKLKVGAPCLQQWHTFWNAGDTPARVLEIISPAGFENYFRELGAELLSGPPDSQRLAALCANALDMDMSSVPGLIQRFGGSLSGSIAPRAALNFAFYELA